jgi:hypothetical protein
MIVHKVVVIGGGYAGRWRTSRRPRVAGEYRVD